MFIFNLALLSCVVTAAAAYSCDSPKGFAKTNKVYYETHGFYDESTEYPSVHYQYCLESWSPPIVFKFPTIKTYYTANSFLQACSAGGELSSPFPFLDGYLRTGFYKCYNYDGVEVWKHWVGYLPQAYYTPYYGGSGDGYGGEGSGDGYGGGGY